MSRIVTLTLNPALDLSTETRTVVPDLKLRCAAPRKNAGGGGVNVSRAIAFLGGRSLAALAVGGATGDQVCALLRGEGIDFLDLGVRPETRENLSVICERSGQQYRFIMPGAPWQPDDVEAAFSDLCDQVQDQDLIVPSGSLPPGLASEDLLALQERLSGLGARTIFDTSGDALRALAAIRSHPMELLRMDHAEAESLCGRGLPSIADIADLTRDLAQSGAARVVVVAKGADGSVLSLASGETWHVRPPKVPVLSKTGAGDSFVAGYVLALSRGASPLQSCVQGVGAAASAVTSPDTDLCTRVDAERFASAAQIEVL